jgi:hypothetical protein
LTRTSSPTPTPTQTGTRTVTNYTPTASYTPTGQCPIIGACQNSGGYLCAPGYPAGNPGVQAVTCTSMNYNLGDVITGYLDPVTNPSNFFSVAHPAGTQFCAVLDGFDDGSGTNRFVLDSYHCVPGCTAPCTQLYGRTFSRNAYCGGAVQVIKAGPPISIPGENDTVVTVTTLAGAGPYRLILLPP